jgi:hypothetical protein
MIFLHLLSLDTGGAIWDGFRLTASRLGHLIYLMHVKADQRANGCVSER